MPVINTKTSTTPRAQATIDQESRKRAAFRMAAQIAASKQAIEMAVQQKIFSPDYLVAQATQVYQERLLALEQDH